MELLSQNETVFRLNVHRHHVNEPQHIVVRAVNGIWYSTFLE